MIMTHQAGLSLEFIHFPQITREQLKAYAEASGDFNPIHLDEEVAKKAGLPGIIAHGMLIAGIMADRANTYVEQDHSLKGYKLVQFQTRFKAMTHLGDIPSVGGSIREVSHDGFVLDLQARNQKGEITTTGIARFKNH